MSSLLDSKIKGNNKISLVEGNKIIFSDKKVCITSLKFYKELVLNMKTQLSSKVNVYERSYLKSNGKIEKTSWHQTDEMQNELVRKRLSIKECH